MAGAAMQMMATVPDGHVIALSTPAGRRGWFFEQWTHGHDWHKVQVPATLCPRISEEFLEQQRRELGPLVFDAEYMNAFVDDGEQVFASALIEAAFTSDVTPLRLFS